jgi:peptidoglycan hydrolase-like protein with peptidoglycan-binding domain
MRRALFLAVLAVVACTNKAATYSGDTTAGAGSSHAAARSAAIAPSDLSAEQIRLVQRSLIDRGFAVDPTGTFDDRTQTALMDFQRARGLPATASLDQPTIDALGIDPRDVMPVRGSATDQNHPADQTGQPAVDPTGRGTDTSGQAPGVRPYDPSGSGQPDSSHPSPSSGDGTDR